MDAATELGKRRRKQSSRLERVQKRHAREKRTMRRLQRSHVADSVATAAAGTAHKTFDESVFDSIGESMLAVVRGGPDEIVGGFYEWLFGSLDGLASLRQGMLASLPGLFAKGRLTPASFLRGVFSFQPQLQIEVRRAFQPLSSETFYTIILYPWGVNMRLAVRCEAIAPLQLLRLRAMLDIGECRGLQTCGSSASLSVPGGQRQLRRVYNPALVAALFLGLAAEVLPVPTSTVFFDDLAWARAQLERSNPFNAATPAVLDAVIAALVGEENYKQLVSGHMQIE